MIWFKIKELEKLIIEKKVTDKLAFDYLLTYLIFTTIAGFSKEDSPVWVEWIQLIVSLIAVIWGIRKTFEINQEGDNQEYFKRLISISFVAGIRIVVFLFPVLLVFNLLSEIFDATGIPLEVSVFQKELMEMAGFIIVTIFYYYILLSSFKRINSVAGKEGKVQAV